MKEVFKAYASILGVLSSESLSNNVPKRNASTAASIIRRIICMLAQLVDLCDKNKEQNTFKAVSYTHLTLPTKA